MLYIRIYIHVCVLCFCVWMCACVCAYLCVCRFICIYRRKNKWPDNFFYLQEICFLNICKILTPVHNTFQCRFDNFPNKKYVKDHSHITLPRRSNHYSSLSYSTDIDINYPFPTFQHCNGVQANRNLLRSMNID